MSSPEKLESPSGKRYTVAEKTAILEAAQQTSVAAAATQHGVSEVTIYAWRKRFEKDGPAGLEDQRQDNPGAKPVPDWKRTKVLAVKESDPGFGPSQIRNQRRREGVTISIESVRQILTAAGYALERRRAPQKDYLRFEASRPLELTQIDICEFYIHKQKVYLVLLLDDYSRFLLNFALLEACNMEQIEKMVAEAIQRYGKPERLVSDRGFVFHGWLSEVERSLARLVENGIDLSLRQLNLFNIALVQGKIELTIMGRKVYILENSSQPEKQPKTDGD
jgi:transposase